ncbi:uncharacterized protein LOC120111615 isoform X5 [Phoenix dactylifera]|uniref:Uncharacterized protein LOC120111615 isoform X5 n=2 Tax=Phoenix dactylifera TaxID=42345 RepID=A0A8B9AH24_PHODC|nr:uncharacterized protein LOC120111615 isoform X5 [Phoenix dactylifera]
MYVTLYETTSCMHYCSQITLWEMFQKGISNLFCICGSLSLISMDFTCENRGWAFSQKENPSWADNIYQKVEKMCTNKMVQVPRKYVNVVGEHVKKFLDEVDEWLDPSSNCAKEIDFDKSIDNDYKKSSERVDENHLNELATSAIEEPIISSMEDMKLVTLPDITQDTPSNEHEKEQIPAETTDSSCTGVDGNYRKTADAFTSSDVTSALSADEVLPSESHNNMVLEERFIVSGNNTSTEICGTSTSKDTASLVQSLGNELEQKIGTNRSEADVQLPESELEEFEDVDLQDSWDDDDEDYELASVSYQEFKNRSYKKKLKAAITSKLRLSKNYGQVAYWHQDTSKPMQDRQGITASSFSKSSSIHDTMESDWEFL